EAPLQCAGGDHADGVPAELGRAALVGDGRGGVAGQLAEPGHRVGRSGHRVPVDLAGDELLGGGGARWARGPREPRPSRTLRPARSTTRPQTTIEITMALRVPTLRNCWGPSRRGTRTSRMTSPGALTV